jgi:hypothetical protein
VLFDVCFECLELRGVYSALIPKIDFALDFKRVQRQSLNAKQVASLDFLAFLSLYDMLLGIPTPGSNN